MECHIVMEHQSRVDRVLVCPSVLQQPAKSKVGFEGEAMKVSRALNEYV